MQRRIVLFAWGIIFLINSAVFADELVLKSGKIINGEVIEKTPDFVKINYNGMPLYFENKLIQSLAIIRDKDIESDPDVFLKRGLTFAANQEFNLAKQEFLSGLKICPSHSNLNGGVSIINDLENGVISCDYALCLFKGSAFLIEKNYEAAVIHLENALKIIPDSVDVFYNLGVSYYSLSKPVEALNYFKKLVVINENDPHLYNLIGNTYLMISDYSNARDSFILARELFKKNNDLSSAIEADQFVSALSKNEPRN